MRKLIAGCVGVVSMASLSFGQIEVGASLGYGFAAGKDQVGANVEAGASGITEWKDVYGSFGGGLKIGLDGTYFLADNVGVMFGTGFSFLGGFSTEMKSTSGTEEFKMSGSYLPINLGLKLKATMGSLSPYAYVAPGMYIVFGSGEEKLTGQPTSDISMKFAPGFGFTSGVGALFGLSDKIGLKVEVTPTYAFANMKETTTEYTDLGVTYKETTVFENNEKTNKPDKISGNETTSYEHGQPRVSFSSVALNVGVNIGF